MRRIAVTLALLWLVKDAAAVARQSTPHPLPAFEVATIKPQTDPRPLRVVSPPDRFIDPDTTLRRLIEFGYETTQAQIAGGPDWIGRADLGLTPAKASGTPSRAEMRTLVRTLLAQRFNLKTHTETREVPVYLRPVETAQLDGGADNLKHIRCDSRATGIEADGNARTRERPRHRQRHAAHA